MQNLYSPCAFVEMMKSLSSLFACALALSTLLAIACGASVGGIVNVLKDSTLADEITSGYWLVEFYAPW